MVWAILRMEQIKMKTCGATDIGGYPIRQMVCDRESGHDGWHNESETGSSWPAKAPPLSKEEKRMEMLKAMDADNDPTATTHLHQ